MKKLVIMRHAKSSRDDIALIDYDRVLNQRGLNDAQYIGSYLYNRLGTPDLIISSPSVRTRQTAELAASKLLYPCEKIQFAKKLYESSLRDIMGVIHDIKDNIKTVVIIGHNPSVSAVSNYLNDNFTEIMPTASAACFSINIDSWDLLSNDDSEVSFFITPKTI